MITTGNPERSASGPITMVVSAADKAIYVYRNGNPIGRAAVEIGGRGALGNHVFSMLEGTTGRHELSGSRAAQARRWMSVTSSGRRADAEKIASRLRDESGVCRESLRHARAGHDRHHHRSTGRAQPPQRRDPRKLMAAPHRAAVEMIAAFWKLPALYTASQRSIRCGI